MAYIIRQTDNALWQAFKKRAATEGHSLRWVIEELIRQYVAHGLKDS
jgi:plasmid stability protein